MSQYICNIDSGCFKDISLDCTSLIPLLGKVQKSVRKEYFLS